MFLKLILGLLKIGTIGYGGGAATMPLVHKEFVEKHEIITEDEFIEILGICNVLPGPLITKYCAVLGYRIKGVFGAIIAPIAIILPSCIMLIVILSFIQNVEQNENIKNMISSIYPIVSVILIKLTYDFIKMSKKRLENKELIISLITFFVLLIGLKLNAAIVIIMLIIGCMFIPKVEGE